MDKYRNVSGSRRIFTRIQHPDTGATLELDAGEVVELDLPKSFEDANLKRVEKKKPKQSSAAAKAKEKTKVGEPAGESTDDKEEPQS